MTKVQIGRPVFAVTTAMLAMLVAIGSASAETALERAKGRGVLRIGFSNAIPNAYTDADGKVTGHDVELAKAIAERLGIKQVDGILTQWSSLIPALKADRIDMTMGMYITPKRCEEVAYSEPFYRMGESFLVKEGNPKKIKDFFNFTKDKGLKLALVEGAADVAIAKEVGIDQSQLLILRDNTSLLAAVQSGRADAGALTAIQLFAMAKKVTGVEATPPFFEVAGKSVAGYGAFGFRKEDKDLLEAFNSQLKTFIGSPEYLAMAAPFGYTKDTLPGDKTAAELCAGK